MAAQGCLVAETAFGPWISGPTRDSEPLLTVPSDPLSVNMPNGMSDTSPNTGTGRQICSFTTLLSAFVCVHAHACALAFASGYAQETRTGQRVRGDSSVTAP